MKYANNRVRKQCEDTEFPPGKKKTCKINAFEWIQTDNYVSSD